MTQVEVTQADRDQAIEYLRRDEPDLDYQTESDLYALVNRMAIGMEDEHPLAQAFARHRLATATLSGETNGLADGPIPVEFYQWLYRIERDVRVWDLTSNEIRQLLTALRQASDTPDGEVGELVERLRRMKIEHKVRSGFGGLVSFHDESETREVPVNPDGPEAADALTRMDALLKEAREVVAPFAEGSIDVSGSAVIVGYPETSEALERARSFLSRMDGGGE